MFKSFFAKTAPQLKSGMDLDEIQYLVNDDRDTSKTETKSPSPSVSVSFEQRVHMDTIAILQNGHPFFRWRIPDDVNVHVLLAKTKFWKFDRKVVYTVEYVGVLKYLKVCIMKQ